jgi:hypothetical protein
MNLRNHEQPCEHGLLVPHHWRNPAWREDWSRPDILCPGGREVTLKEAGSMARSWRCLNCGDSHEDTAGCDEPDFNSVTFYTIEEVR